MSTVTLEEYNCRTWPALETVPYDGWLLRFGAGCTNRANAVYGLYRSTYDIERKIAFCEQEYRARGLRPVFRITDATTPMGLDAVLQSAGYEIYEPSLTMIAALTAGPEMTGTPVRLSETFEDSWLDAYFEFQPAKISQRDGYKMLFGLPGCTRVFASVIADGKIAAVGMASRSRDHAGIYNMATHPDYRGRGYAEAIVQALKRHTYQHGARTAILSVSAGNTVAHRVYTRCGFGESYRYCYRVHADS